MAFEQPPLPPTQPSYVQLSPAPPLALCELLEMKGAPARCLRAPLGTRREEVEGFLLGGLQPASLARYDRALVLFSTECAEAGIVFSELSAERQDWILAEYIWRCHEEGLPCGGAASAVAAVAKVNPGRKYPTSFRVLERWRTERPPRQAPAIPPQLAWGMFTVLWGIGRHAEALILLLCFCGLLRVSEGLGLHRASCLVSYNSVILVLPRTKRGFDERVVLTHNAVIGATRAYFLLHPVKEGRCFDTSYVTFSRWLKFAASWMGFGDLEVTSHSLRRGGATALLSLGYAFNDVQLYGRWSSDRSVREYLRRGQTALLRMDPSQPRWRLADCLGSLCDFVVKMSLKDTDVR